MLDFSKNAGFVATLVILLTSFGNRHLQSGEHRFERSEIHMGTSFKIIVYASNEDVASTAFNAAFQRIGELDQCLSNYKTDSELNRLCQLAPHAKPVHVGDDLFTVMEESDRISQLSGGAFDVTVGPITKLWRRARRLQNLPDEGRLREAMELVGFQQVLLNRQNKTIQLSKANMKIDLGGIAKGFAIDAALQLISQHGLKSALVDGGGDVAVSNPPPGRDFWLIKIGDPKSETPDCLKLTNRAVATSGDLFQFVEIDGTRYSHIVDPKTGVGLTQNVSTTVIASNATQADGLASAGAVMGSQEGVEPLASIPNVHARWSERNGADQMKTTSTDKFRDFLVPCQIEDDG